MSASRFPVSAWAIRNPVPVSVLFLGLIIAGLIAYLTLPIKLYPNVQYPLVSVTVRVMVALPGWFPDGIAVTVRALPAPPMAMPETGSKVVLEDLAVTMRDPAGVSRSPTVKAMAAVDLPWGTD